MPEEVRPLDEARYAAIHAPHTFGCSIDCAPGCHRTSAADALVSLVRAESAAEVSRMREALEQIARAHYHTPPCYSNFNDPVTPYCGESEIWRDNIVRIAEVALASLQHQEGPDADRPSTARRG